VPHAVALVPGSQASPTQQPTQLYALHAGFTQTPSLQVSPCGQARQAAPPVPHAVVLVPDSHASPVQQPLQLYPLQAGFSQVPALQVSPFGQARQVLPPSPHSAELVPGWQVPLRSQQPPQVSALQVGLWQ
jgi:hypothetical protein